jgi:hypothetical protein
MRLALEFSRHVPPDGDVVAHGPCGVADRGDHLIHHHAAAVLAPGDDAAVPGPARRLRGLQSRLEGCRPEVGGPPPDGLGAGPTVCGLERRVHVPDDAVRIGDHDGFPYLFDGGRQANPLRLTANAFGDVDCRDPQHPGVPGAEGDALEPHVGRRQAARLAAHLARGFLLSLPGLPEERLEGGQ